MAGSADLISYGMAAQASFGEDKAASTATTRFGMDWGFTNARLTRGENRYYSPNEGYAGAVQPGLVEAGYDARWLLSDFDWMDLLFTGGAGRSVDSVTTKLITTQPKYFTTYLGLIAGGSIKIPNGVMTAFGLAYNINEAVETTCSVLSGNGELLSADFDRTEAAYGEPFRYADATINIGGALAEIQSFNLDVSMPRVPKYGNSADGQGVAMLGSNIEISGSVLLAQNATNMGRALSNTNIPSADIIFAIGSKKFVVDLTNIRITDPSFAAQNKDAVEDTVPFVAGRMAAGSAT